MMLKKIFSDPKRVALFVGAAVVLAFVCLALLTGPGWRAYRNQATPEPTVEPVDFGYCGDRLTSLCVVSFGRDVLGNTIINLYVPTRKYPVFYLKVIRQSGEFRYDCSWNDNIRTSVYCSGNALNLGEGFVIQMLSQKNDRILAEGVFALNAFRVTTPVVASDSQTGTAPAPVSTIELDEMNAPTGPEPQFTPSTDPASTSSYPGYP